MNRRGFLRGLGSLIAAPAIVQASSLMPVRGIIMPTELLTVYGASPAMIALPDLRQLQMMLVERIINPVRVLHDDGTFETLSTAAEQEALHRLVA